MEDTTIDTIEAAFKRGANEEAEALLLQAGGASSGKAEDELFFIGDLAALIPTHARDQQLIEKLAAQTIYSEAQVREYRRVCVFWDRKTSLRNELRAELKLHYSHYRDAAALKDMDKALAFVKDCATHGWGVNEAHKIRMERMGKPLPPEPPQRLVHGARKMRRLRGLIGTFSFTSAEVTRLLDAYDNGDEIMLTIHSIPKGGTDAKETESETPPTADHRP